MKYGLGKKIVYSIIIVALLAAVTYGAAVGTVQRNVEALLTLI